MNQVIQKSPRGRGRPRGYDESAALDRAVDVFWRKGFDGATIDDLVAATGVGRPSLYATFGDKESLFMRCLERYGERMGASVGGASDSDPRGAVASFLCSSVVNATQESGPKGCMVGCVASVVDDARVREFVAASIEGVARAFERRFDEAIASGALPATFPAARRSRQVVDVSMALALRARVGASREELLADAEDAATLLTNG